MSRNEVVCELPVANRARQLRRELTQQRAYERRLPFVKALCVKGFLEGK
jgi:hypothetical protein